MVITLIKMYKSSDTNDRTFTVHSSEFFLLAIRTNGWTGSIIIPLK
jgi:hypothetical protein